MKRSISDQPPPPAHQVAAAGLAESDKDAAIVQRAVWLALHPDTSHPINQITGFWRRWIWIRRMIALLRVALRNPADADALLQAQLEWQHERRSPARDPKSFHSLTPARPSGTLFRGGQN